MTLAIEFLNALQVAIQLAVFNVGRSVNLNAYVSDIILHTQTQKRTFNHHLINNFCERYFFTSSKMMEYALDEDIPEEFKGGTLQINEDKKSNEEATAISHANKTTAKNNKENNNIAWKDDNTDAAHLNDSNLNYKVESSTVQPYALKLVNENAINFFTFRADIVNKAIKECMEHFLDPKIDGELVHCSLLTEINLWDTEKERLILLTTNTLINIKYDFIALRMLDYRKVPLENVDSIVIGELVYPNASLMPRLNGIAEGVSNVVQSCFLQQKWPGGNANFIDAFGPRNRNMQGIRIMWNKGQALDFVKKWNPFCTEIPMCTFISHPLLYHKDCNNENQRKLYDAEEFIRKLCEVISNLEKTVDDYVCCVLRDKIILENYVGIGSLVHNRNALGFFKVRGKFSF